MKEQKRGGFDRPRNKEELVNLRHGSGRNVVERPLVFFQGEFKTLSHGNECKTKGGRVSVGPEQGQGECPTIYPLVAGEVEDAP